MAKCGLGLTLSGLGKLGGARFYMGSSVILWWLDGGSG